MFGSNRQSVATFAADMPSDNACKGQAYLSGPDPFLPALWLDRPEIPNPIASCPSSTFAVGGTPDFSTVYFTSPGPLLPEDASRIGGGGFYEDSGGILREAGVLPDGSLSPFGASSAALPREGVGASEGNGISADGSRAFFVSPDPASCEQNGGQNNCTVDPPELYVREEGARSVLVSQDTLLPDVGGLPAPAPDGLNPTNTTLAPNHRAFVSGYVFASPDGSQAFFQSEDQLTSNAPAGPPGNTSPKTYDFDVDTGTLTYLPGVVGKIVATDTDGSSLAFVNSTVSPAELDLWSAGATGGTVTPITQIPEAGVSETRMSSDGSVVVFGTRSRLSSSFNSGGFEQIYRYDALSNTLGCVSCAPAGVTPTGPALMSEFRALQYEEELSPGLEVGETGVIEPRSVSSDGDRIFFDTPAPLVPQATNSDSGVRDVYEWENGVVYLISSGRSTHNSYFLDNSENGDDVFFATNEGLVPGDTDGAYDVYDARVPQPGDNPPPAAVPCEGSACQGPPSVASPLAAPASATFSGLGNIAPEPAPAPFAPTKTTAKTVKCKKGYVKKKNKCVEKYKAKKSAKGRK